MLGKGNEPDNEPGSSVATRCVVCTFCGECVHCTHTHTHTHSYTYTCTRPQSRRPNVAIFNSREMAFHLTSPVVHSG